MNLNLPDIQDYPEDPNHTAWDQWKDTPYEKSAGEVGGKSKITKTDMSGASSAGMQGYGFMTNDASMKIQGMAPDGNSSGIPAAKPISPITYGDPNDSAIDHKDGFSPTGIDETRHGF